MRNELQQLKKCWVKLTLITALLLVGIAVYAFYPQAPIIPYFYMPDHVWQAHFETGTFSEYRGGVRVGCGHTEPLSPNPYVHHTISTISISDNYSEFDYYYGPPNSVACRAYQIVNLAIPPYDAYNLDDQEISLTIMVPSHINGDQINVTSWLSFVTVGTGVLNNGWTIDSGPDRDIHLWLACKDYVNDSCEAGTVPSATPYQWTLDEPFTLHAVYLRSTDVLGQRIIIWVNDFSGNHLIVNYTGRTAPAVPGRYQYYHFGLYMGPGQGTIGWYEDDIEISIP